MKEKQILNIFKQAEALKEGHFLLSSGLHSKRYLQGASVLKYPKSGEILCKELAVNFKDKRIDVVIGPAIGGIILSYQMAKILNARSIFAERVNDKMQLRRDFDIKKNEKVLIVEDVVTTGASVKGLVNLVKRNKAELIGIATLVDRSSDKIFKNMNFVSLLKLDIKTYKPEVCPLCGKGTPLEKLGSH